MHRHSDRAERRRVTHETLGRKELLLEEPVVLGRRPFGGRHGRPGGVVDAPSGARVVVRPFVEQVGVHDGRQDPVQRLDHVGRRLVERLQQLGRRAAERGRQVLDVQQPLQPGFLVGDHSVQPVKPVRHDGAVPDVCVTTCYQPFLVCRPPVPRRKSAPATHRITLGGAVTLPNNFTRTEFNRRTSKRLVPVNRQKLDGFRK